MGTINQLRWWAYKILPLAYDDSLSYYEAMDKTVNKVNELVDRVNDLPKNVSDEIKKQLSGDGDVFNNLFSGLINAIATKESDSISFTPNNKQGGELIWLGDTLYEVVAEMQSGMNYIVGTNIVPVDIDDELKNIKSFISTHNEGFHTRASGNHNAQSYLIWKDKLYRVDDNIKVNDILSERHTVNGSTTGQLTVVNAMDEITAHYIEMHESDNNLQTQIDGNDGDIAKLQTEQKSQSNRISNIVAQSGNDNSEIVDGRKWATKFGTSVTSSSIGDAIRGQIEASLNAINPTISLSNGYSDLNDVNKQAVYGIIGGGLKNYPSYISKQGMLIYFSVTDNTEVQVLYTNDGTISWRIKWGGNWGSWTILNNVLTTGLQSLFSSNTPDLNDVQPQTVYATNLSEIKNSPNVTSSQGVLLSLGYGPTGCQIFTSIGGDFAYRTMWNNQWSEWKNITEINNTIDLNTKLGYLSATEFKNTLNTASTVYGITFKPSKIGIEAVGTATDNASVWLSGSPTSFPNNWGAGETKWVKQNVSGSGNIVIRISYYTETDRNIVLYEESSSVTKQVSLPSNAIGAIIYCLVYKNNTVNGNINIEYSENKPPLSNIELTNTLENDINPKDFLYASFCKMGVIGDSYASGFLYGSGSPTNVPFYSWGKYMERMSGMDYKIFAKGGLEVTQWLTDSDVGLNVALKDENLCNGYIIALGINDSARHTIDYIGTVSDINDNDYTQNADSFIGNYAKILQGLKSKVNAKFFLTTMPIPTVKNSAMANRYQSYNNAIKEIANHFTNCYLLDLTKYADYYNAEFWQKGLNNSHPTPATLAYAAKIMASAINDVMYDNISEFLTIDYINGKEWTN